MATTTTKNYMKEKEDKVFDALKGQFGYTNVMQAPRLSKLVVSVGVGSVKDKKKIELIANRLSRITGQKAAVRNSTKSIATFKVRIGDIAGYQTTLRGARMREFIDKLLNIAFPRTKDFRGLDPKGIDAMGNFSIGVKEHTIFPETSDEELKDVFGMSITIVTTSKTKQETKAFLDVLGFPFKR